MQKHTVVRERNGDREKPVSVSERCSEWRNAGIYEYNVALNYYLSYFNKCFILNIVILNYLTNLAHNLVHMVSEVGFSQKNKRTDYDVVEKVVKNN